MQCLIWCKEDTVWSQLTGNVKYKSGTYLTKAHVVSPGLGTECEPLPSLCACLTGDFRHLADMEVLMPRQLP